MSSRTGTIFNGFPCGFPVCRGPMSISLAFLSPSPPQRGSGLLLALAAYVLAKIASHSMVNWPVFASILCLSYGIACPWIPPSTIKTVVLASQYANGSFPFSARHALLAVAIALGAGAIVWISRRHGVSTFATFILVFAFLTAVGPVTNELTGFAILPQPHRFHLEMELALTMAGCYFVWGRLREATATSWRLLCAGILLFSAVQTRRFR